MNKTETIWEMKYYSPFSIGIKNVVFRHSELVSESEKLGIRS